MHLDAIDSETPAERKKRAAAIVETLRSAYPDATCALHHRNGLELAVATVLSAQCTDERVNQVTPALFERYPNAADYAGADLGELEDLVRTTGFFRQKARSLQRLGTALVEHHDGQVPDTLEALVKLPGIGRKTANVLLGTWFGKPGIAVDTHVKRLTSRRLELTRQTDPVKIELDLQNVLAKEDWTFASHALILHGRQVCGARRPACSACELQPHCPHPARELARKT